MTRLLVSFITCALSFPKKLWKKEWPTIVDEPPDYEGGFIHRMNNVAVETVRANANFYTKAFAFVTAALLILGVLT